LEPIVIDVKALVFAGVQKKEANVWPLYGNSQESLDRSSVVTSSEVGYCERKVYLDKVAMRASGYSPEKGTSYEAKTNWGFFERGHNVEAWLVDALHKGNDGKHVIILTGNNQRSFANKYQAGTPDGVTLQVLEDESDLAGFYVLEFKSFDPRTNIGKLPKSEHVKQCQQNMDLISQELEKPPLGAIIVYVNASDYMQIYQFQIDFDEETADRLLDKAKRILSAKTASDLEPEGLYMDHCKYCSHTAACNAAIAASASNRKLGENHDSIAAAAASLFGQPQTRP
jgi:CRISPR/Cas system-associated exonuclease Cas4 (RecB family)